MGKNSAYIKDNLKILNTSIEPVLNVDRNGDKSTDSEVFESAQKAKLSGYDYVFVHFHGMDEKGHDYGDINDEVMCKIKEIDGYIQRLTEGFHGRVIVAIDHGMLKTKDGGKPQCILVRGHASAVYLLFSAVISFIALSADGACGVSLSLNGCKREG